MTTESVRDGIREYRCIDWEDFNKFVNEFSTEPVERTTIIWRGQRDSKWPLESSLTRLVKKIPKTEWVRVRDHVKNFAFATRGRRGANPRLMPESADDDWWTLGRHHGLATPLLDWTSSPYTAAFFAYAKKESPHSKFRVVFGLSEKSVEWKSSEIYRQWKQKHDRLIAEGRPDRATELNEADTIEFIRPMTDENQRLVSQGGLFTRSPFRRDVVKWVSEHCKGDTHVRLHKVLLPDGERVKALKALNRMNINYLSLFPDLEGASLHCNMQLSIDHY